MNTIASNTQSPVLRGVTNLFLLAAVVTACWLGLNLALPELQATGIPSVVIRLVVHTTLLAGLWLGIAQTDFDGGTRIRVWLAIALPFTAWLAVVWWLAVDGAFRPRPGVIVPALPIAILAPVLLGLPFLLRSRRIGAILDAAPASWLVGIQVYRVFGGIFLVAWARGDLSGTFALPAGTGDVLVGLLALPVAYLLHTRARGSRAAAVAWNILGLVDFAIAIGIGFLSAPGPLQLIIPDRPNVQLGMFPTVMIPAFAVPSSILLHALAAAAAPARAQGTRPWGLAAPVLQYHGGGLFGDHQGGRVGVARGDRRHDRGIGHPQALEPAHLQPGIDHRPGSTPMRAVPTGWKMVVEMSPAALASSSSSWNSTPGRNSSGWYFASAGIEMMLRVTRMDCAATWRSSLVER